MKDFIIKIGRAKATILVTLLTVISSMLLSSIFLISFSNGINLTGLVISAIVPGIVSPFIFWYIIDLLVKIHYLEEQQRALATFDQLTGLMSRRAFLTNFETLFLASKRNASTLVLAYIDIDDFKKINDKYGHGGGDKVLESIGLILRQNLRESDLVGRIGGEEFSIVLPGTNIEDANCVLEAIMAIVANNEVEFSSNVIQYSVSIGITVMDDSSQFDSQELSRRADLALYQAKSKGKNCIIEFAPRPALG